MTFEKAQLLQGWLRQKLGNSIDVVFQEVEFDSKKAVLLYISSICDEKKLHEDITTQLMELTSVSFKEYLKSMSITKTHESNEQTLAEIMSGSVCIFMYEEVFLVDLKKLELNATGEATVETVIQGPQKAICEEISTNLNIIRHRYPQPSLRIEETVVGKQSRTKVMIVYDNKLYEESILKEIKQSLDKVDLDVVQAAGELQRGLSKQKRTLFPTMMITERPDRIAYNLAQGKVVLLIDGTPFSLIAPAVFFDFLSSMEDLYQSFWISRFIVSLRYIGLFISLLLPAFYVGVTAYNPELFRVQLALSIAGSRMGVPYPAYLEVLFMLIMMELLTEASVRLPKAIGSTATTVGGLILGTAAVEAGLVSNVMIIIVAAVAISNFVIPINAMSFAMRVVKYILLLFTTFFGMVGLVFGVILVIAYLTNIDSYGHPYLKLFIIPSNKREATPESKEVDTS
jgi:hypothetical protein